MKSFHRIQVVSSFYFFFVVETSTTVLPDRTGLAQPFSLLFSFRRCIVIVVTLSRQADLGDRIAYCVKKNYIIHFNKIRRIKKEKNKTFMRFSTDFVYKYFGITSYNIFYMDNTLLYIYSTRE